jgi:TonB family protein
MKSLLSIFISALVLISFLGCKRTSESISQKEESTLINDIKPDSSLVLKDNLVQNSGLPSIQDKTKNEKRNEDFNRATNNKKDSLPFKEKPTLILKNKVKYPEGNILASKVETKAIKTKENLKLNHDSESYGNLVAEPGPPPPPPPPPPIETKIICRDGPMPQFPGGQTALSKFFSDNLVYPDSALAKKISGKVVIQFVINTDGGTTNLKVVRGIGNGCDEEAIRIASTMPNWIPAEENGQKFAVKYTIPVSFKLPKNESLGTLGN